MFRNVTLKCLNEVAGVSGANYDDMFISLFTQTMGQLEAVRIKPSETVCKDWIYDVINLYLVFRCFQSIQILKKHMLVAKIKSRISSRTWQCSCALF